MVCILFYFNKGFDIMEDKSLITYKWESGVYDLEDLIKLVENEELTVDEFFEITRLNYAATKNPN